MKTYSLKAPAHDFAALHAFGNHDWNMEARVYGVNPGNGAVYVVEVHPIVSTPHFMGGGTGKQFDTVEGAIAHAKTIAGIA